ncbi:MAG: hypothetical protein R2748_23190 [Bryobacterales bacterium]
MANLCLAAAAKLKDLLLAPDGLGPRLYEISQRDMVEIPNIMPPNVILRRAAPDFQDENDETVYPAVLVYCERLENRLEQKFTAFSGRLYLVVDILVTGQTLDSIDGDAERAVEAVMDLLAENHGQWTENVAFDGRLEVDFDAAKRGAVNYLGRARVRLALLVCA